MFDDLNRSLTSFYDLSLYNTTRKIVLLQFKAFINITCSSILFLGTSLKAFMLEANGLNLTKFHGQGNSLNLVHFVETVNKYGLQQMYQLNATAAVSITKNYFNTMAIRHPFDRLVAYYRDKIVDTDRYKSLNKINTTVGISLLFAI